jgi:hypothetical protein
MIGRMEEHIIELLNLSEQGARVSGRAGDLKSSEAQERPGRHRIGEMSIARPTTHISVGLHFPPATLRALSREGSVPTHRLDNLQHPQETEEQLREATSDDEGHESIQPRDLVDELGECQCELIEPHVPPVILGGQRSGMEWYEKSHIPRTAG